MVKKSKKASEKTSKKAQSTNAAPKPTKQEAKQPVGWDKDGIDGSGVGRKASLAAILLGIIAIVFSWVIVGAVFGGFAIICGIVAIVQAAGARRRVQAAGRQASVGGPTGLGIVGIILGVAGIAVSVLLLITANDAIDRCGHLDKTTAEYQECVQNA